MAPLPHFEQLLVEEGGGVLAVAFKDNALSDAEALAATCAELALLAGARPGANVVVDVGKAERLSSPVLALLIGLHRKLHNLPLPPHHDLYAPTHPLGTRVNAA